MSSGLARFTRPDDAPDGSGASDVRDRAGRPAPLRRFLGPRRAPDGEVCELCAAPIGDEHRHVVDLEHRGMLCSCRGCALLFTEAGTGNHRTVPEDHRRVEPFVLDPVAWAQLGIPVGVTFVVAASHLDGEHVAFHPSPGGATESELPPGTWAPIVAANPVLGEVEADVEAVLVRTDVAGPGRPDRVPERPECYVLPVDRCYELVGTLRLHWRGFDGGGEVRDTVAAFFDDLAAWAEVVP